MLYGFFFLKKRHTIFNSEKLPTYIFLWIGALHAAIGPLTTILLVTTSFVYSLQSRNRITWTNQYARTIIDRVKREQTTRTKNTGRRANGWYFRDHLPLVTCTPVNVDIRSVWTTRKKWVQQSISGSIREIRVDVVDRHQIIKRPWRIDHGTHNPFFYRLASVDVRETSFG